MDPFLAVVLLPRLGCLPITVFGTGEAIGYALLLDSGPTSVIDIMALMKGHDVWIGTWRSPVGKDLISHLLTGFLYICIGLLKLRPKMKGTMKRNYEIFLHSLELMLLI
jgi:hypothetical protein